MALKTRTRTKRRVAVLVETSTAYGRGLLHGVVRFAHAHETWTICLGEYRGGLLPPDELSGRRCDGVIVRLESPKLARLLAPLKLPIVDVSQFRLLPHLPFVDADDEAIARLAFAHFTERGFRHFAFVGNDAIGWSRHRRHAFEQIVKDARMAGHSFSAKPRAAAPACYHLPEHELARWVARLPHPCAVFAAWDGFGRQVLHACKRAKLQVPDEIAVLGVGDDPLETDLSQPSLSSIVPDAEGAGYRASALLDQLMAGQRNLPQHIALPPLRVVARQSTDALAYEDQRVAAAVRLIRAQACQGLRVSDVEQAVPLSRRQLEQRFRQHLGHSPHQEIQRVRLCRAKELLRDTDLTLSAIADQLGFEHSEYFCVLFKRIVGMSPGSYRRRVRAVT